MPLIDDTNWCLDIKLVSTTLLIANPVMNHSLLICRRSSIMVKQSSVMASPRLFHTTLISRIKDPVSSKDQDQSSKKTKEEKNGSQKVTDKPPSKPGAVDDLLEKVRPQLELAYRLYNTSKEQVNGVLVPLKFHWEKAKKALREANEKLDQQEKESASYAFKEDYTQVAGEKQHIIQGLPSDRERNRKRWAKRLEFYIDSLQETIFTATRALNDVTGYSSIQKLRESIEVLERQLIKAKEEAAKSKIAYNEAIKNRIVTQKEVNELLQRKSTWDPSDLEKFTKLYKEDQDNALREEKAKILMEKAESHEEELQEKLSNAILTRYHEEQIWSDKIRRTSTWGTFGLMGINILLFLVFQLALEPWKRRRLVGNFEQKVQKALEENALQQNERLDIMSEKVEELKNSDRLPPLEERLESEINEEEYELAEPPEIRTLPLPPPEVSIIIQKIRYYLDLILEPFKSPFLLLFDNNYQKATLSKTELLSTVSLTLFAGVLLQTLFYRLI